MHDELVAKVRDISQKLTATSTLVVTTTGPNPVATYSGNTFSTFWTNVEGLIERVQQSSGQKPRFVTTAMDGEYASLPRPPALVIMTADAHTHVAEAIAAGEIDRAELAEWILRLVVLAPEPILGDDARFYDLSAPLLRLDGTAAVRSRSDDDADARATSVGAAQDEELRRLIESGDIDGAHERLRERSYLDGLRSRILRMQYEVDHFRLIAELALVSDEKSRKELRAIKRSNRYRLAFAGSAPIQSVKKGRRVLQQRRAAKSGKPGESSPKELQK